MVIMLVKNVGRPEMIEVTTAEAKKHLSDLLRRAQAGEVISITRYGKVVATINPPKRTAPDMQAFREQHGRTRGSALDALSDERDEARY